MLNGQRATDNGQRSSWRAAVRLVAWVLLVLAGIDVAVFAARDVWRRYDPNDYVERVDGCREHACELLVVGGSAVDEGVVPAALTGLRWGGERLRRVYNLGLPGATSSEVWHAVSHGIDGRAPAVLVYGVTASDLNDNRQEPQGPHALMDVADVVDWVAHRPRSAEWVLRRYLEGRFARLWQLYYYRNGIRLWAADHVERLWPGFCPAAARDARTNLALAAAMRERPDGYAPRPWFQNARLDHGKVAGAVSMRFPFLDRFRLGEHLSYLLRLVDWAAARGVSIVLVDMPVSADLERLHADAFARYREALAAMEREHGVPVLYATRAAVGLRDADFADLIHMNRRGGLRFSRWLRRQLDGGPEGMRAQRTPAAATGGERDA